MKILCCAYVQLLIEQRDMAGFHIQVSLLYLSLLYALASMHTYDAATGIFSTTLKIDWVSRKVERSNIRSWFGIMLTMSRVMYGRDTFSKYNNNCSKGFQTNIYIIRGKSRAKSIDLNNVDTCKVKYINN